MAHEIVMPQLGLSMDAGRIAGWRKHSGDWVRPGEPLLDVESDKATIEVEAVAAGRLAIVLDERAGEVRVGTVVGYLLAEGEREAPVATRSNGGERLPARAPEATEPASTPASAPAVEAPLTGTPAEEGAAARLRSSPAARRRARELGVDWRMAQGSGPAGRIKVRDVERLAAEPRPEPHAEPDSRVAEPTAVVLTPVAQRLAEALGLELDALRRAFPQGQRIQREDVEAYVRGLLAARPAPDLGSAAAAAAPERRPLGSVRRTIAARMVQSHTQNAPVTLTTKADATSLAAARAAFRAAAQSGQAGGFVPSYSALFARIAAVALAEQPALNAALEGDEVVLWPSIHIGVAVDTERGLLVPVVRDVPAKPLRVLTQEYADLAARAQQGTLAPDELRGGTFTITNLGPYEIDAFTPMINPPECAILGVGRLVDEVVAVAGQPVVRTMVALSLTFDHRLVDGGPAARFLQRVRQLVEQPYLWLAG